MQEEKKEPEKVKPTISKREKTTMIVDGEEVPAVHLRYSTPNLPPKDLWIPMKEYKEKGEDQIIAKDILKRRKKKPEKKVITVKEEWRE